MVSEGFRATIRPLIPPETRSTAQSPRPWKKSENGANLLKTRYKTIQYQNFSCYSFWRLRIAGETSARGLKCFIIVFRMVWGQPVTAPAALSHRGAIARGGGCHGRPHTAAGKTSQNEYPVQNQRWYIAPAVRNEPPRSTFEKRISDAQ
jgi:hypothetical protein